MSAQRSTFQDRANKDLVAILSQIKRFVRAERYEDAVALCDAGMEAAQLAKIDGADIKFMDAKGRALLSAQQFGPAIKALEPVTQALPQYGQGWYALSMAHYSLGKGDEAASVAELGIGSCELGSAMFPMHGRAFMALLESDSVTIIDYVRPLIENDADGTFSRHPKARQLTGLLLAALPPEERSVFARTELETKYPKGFVDAAFTELQRIQRALQQHKITWGFQKDKTGVTRMQTYGVETNSGTFFTHAYSIVENSHPRAAHRFGQRTREVENRYLPGLWRS